MNCLDLKKIGPSMHHRRRSMHHIFSPSQKSRVSYKHELNEPRLGSVRNISFVRVSKTLVFICWSQEVGSQMQPLPAITMVTLASTISTSFTRRSHLALRDRGRKRRLLAAALETCVSDILLPSAMISFKIKPLVERK